MCDKIKQLKKELPYQIFRRIEQFTHCPYCGEEIIVKDKCPICDINLKYHMFDDPQTGRCQGSVVWCPKCRFKKTNTEVEF